MESAVDCLVRYGLMGHVGWFALDAGVGPALERGQAVVIRTSRGVELGEVLIVPEAPDPTVGSRAGEDSVGAFRVLRPADDDDLARGRAVDRLREDRFEACRRIVSEAGWPLELIDVEPLLDQTTLLHYLGVGELDLGPIRARFRASCEFEVGFEDLRADLEAAPAADAPRKGGCDGCSASDASGRGEPSHAGCSSCGVAALLRDRRRDPRSEPAALASS